MPSTTGRVSPVTQRKPGRSNAFIGCSSNRKVRRAILGPTAAFGGADLFSTFTKQRSKLTNSGGASKATSAEDTVSVPVRIQPAQLLSVTSEGGSSLLSAVGGLFKATPNACSTQTPGIPAPTTTVPGDSSTLAASSKTTSSKDVFSLNLFSAVKAEEEPIATTPTPADAQPSTTAAAPKELPGAAFPLNFFVRTAPADTATDAAAQLGSAQAPEVAGFAAPDLPTPGPGFPLSLFAWKSTGDDVDQPQEQLPVLGIAGGGMFFFWELGMC